MQSSASQQVQMKRSASSVSVQSKNGSSNGKNSNQSNRVKVVVRIRPPISEDTKQNYNGDFLDCTTISEDETQVMLSRQAYEDRTFSFDRVLNQDADQQEMYNVVGKPVVNDVLLGYNGTILAYGQTGTGKTFTIFGPGNWDNDSKKKVPERPISVDEDGNWIPDQYNGVIPRAVHQLFEHIREHSDDAEFRVTVSFCQIYMENIMDLLDATKNNLNIREDPKLGIYVDNLTQIQVNEPQDIFQLIREGAQNRAVSSTNMNKLSSRSHVILTITVEQKPYESLENQKVETSVKRGTLTIVDLAGSERVAKSGSEGQRLEEAKKINKSLSALGNCVAALTDDSMTHVPFRDSKLTRLLTDSLGGNAKTCLVATIGPAVWNYDESYSTLTFATRAMAVKNHAVINEVVDFKTLSGNLQKKISLIENEKVRLLARNVDLEREVAILRSELKNASSSNSSNHPHQRTNTVTVSEPEKRNGLTWEQREKQLVDKFTRILNNWRMDEARQNIMFFGQAHNDSEVVLEQMISGFLNIPQVRRKILAKLIPDFKRLTLAEMDDMENQHQMQQLQMQQLLDHLQKQQQKEQQHRQQLLEQQQQYAEQADVVNHRNDLDELTSFFEQSGLSHHHQNSPVRPSLSVNNSFDDYSLMYEQVPNNNMKSFNGGGFPTTTPHLMSPPSGQATTLNISTNSMHINNYSH